jgi:hypothetical protein
VRVREDPSETDNKLIWAAGIRVLKRVHRRNETWKERPTAHWLEYLDLAGAVHADPYRPVDGTVVAKGPGLGIEWDESAITRFAVGRR